jgi:cell division protein FtsN
MRIDYSEPRQSYGVNTSGPGSSPRKADGSSSNLLMMFLLSVVIFVTGFGTGWFFSQKSAKKAFRAAMEQQSLESAPKNAQKQVEQPQLPQSQPAQTAPAVTPSAAVPSQQQQASPTGQVPLGFFENLPKGQKQVVLGSGINQKPKPAPVVVQPPAQMVPPSQKTTDAKAATSFFVVQVAAFTSLKEAENAKAKLSAKGYSATVAETNLNDKGTWYRVRVGRHLDKESATEIAARIGGGAKILPDQD